MDRIPPTTGLAVLLVAAAVWRQRREIAQAWTNRRLFNARIFWSVALLYALSSAAVTFASFGAVHLGMRATSTAMQILAGAGLLSLPLALLIARKLATPIFDQNAIAQRDRFHFHAVWMSFWMLGILIGLLPLFVSA